MGCWNKTCGLSHLHINAGDEVVVVALEQNTDDSDRCYTTSFWRPVMVPFYAVYDDYGGGEDSRGVGVDLLVDGLKRSAINTPDNDDDEFDPPVIAAEMTIDRFYKHVHNGKLYMHHRYGDRSPLVDFVMLRKDVVDRVLSTHQIESYVRATGGYVKWGFKDVTDGIPELIVKLKQVYGANECGVDIQFALRYDSANRAESILYRYGTSTYQHSALIRMPEIVAQLSKDGDDDKLTELLCDVLTFAYLDMFMDTTRRYWAPGGHEGSQNTDHDGHLTLCHVIQAVLADEKADMERDFS